MKSKNNLKKQSLHLFMHLQLRYILLFVFALLILPLSYADIYISEVIYDPLRTESGGEVVELHNTGNKAIDLSGYVLMTASSEADAELPSGSVIEPEGFFLIADSGWSEDKDSPDYPLADHEEVITMKNSDSGICILDNNSIRIDCVGWGESDQIESNLYSGNPANSTEPGNSLNRISYSGDNSIDFVESIPSLVNSFGMNSDSRNNVISLRIEIADQDSFISNIDYPSIESGEVMLMPGEQIELNVSFDVISTILPDTAALLYNGTTYQSNEYSSNSTHVSYYTNLSLDHYALPGEHEFEIMVDSGDNTYLKNSSFNISSLIGFEIDISSINESFITDNSFFYEGDNDLSTPNNPSIKNLGNVPLDFSIQGDNLTSEDKEIDISNVMISIADDSFQPLTNDAVLYNTLLSPGPESIIPFSIKGNFSSESPGAYETSIVIRALESSG